MRYYNNTNNYFKLAKSIIIMIVLSMMISDIVISSCVCADFHVEVQDINSEENKSEKESKEESKESRHKINTIFDRCSLSIFAENDQSLSEHPILQWSDIHQDTPYLPPELS